MDEKNDLINNINGKDDKKLRKILFIGGSIFILFVMVVVVSKFLFSSDKDDTKVILPTEIKQVKSDTQKDDNLFQDIPVDDNTAVIEEKQFKKPEPQNNEVINDNVKENVANNTEVVEISKKKVQELKETKEKSLEMPKSKPITHNKYYIQVAAVIRKEPSKKFLELIRTNGFEYTIVEVNVKGNQVKRVLVGPYNGYSEAKKALAQVKKTISSSAFIKRVK